MADRTAHVRRDQVQYRRRRRSEAPDTKALVQKKRPDFGGIQKISQIVVGLVQLFDVVIELTIDGDLLLVDGLQFLLRSFQLFIGGLQLLVDGQTLLMGGREFFMRALAALDVGLAFLFWPLMIRFA